ncbi:MAG: bifunctional folylpolyglutamate synthase/dihydrofolate synthase [candidate division Zixibacteria bacterium]|nr:bifunctional folylpolyglutamate synthase/dihydrofolate synthase [candidate division Zixibacteria bacterium]
MEYNDILRYLLDLELFGVKFGLTNISRMLAILGDPHKAYPTIHIAGTNGKGSTSAIISSILANCGYRVGLYTSPHLVDFRERIRINDKLISKKHITDFFTANKERFEPINPTFFEVVTALAFDYFRQEKVDIAVIETGLGGRLDATNVITPVVSVITNIEFEHTKQLGTQISQIAMEKAGIIKTGVPVVTAVKNIDAGRVIRQTCVARKTKLISIFDETQYVIKEINESKTELDVLTRSQKYYNLRLPLPGRHQLDNAVCALIAIEVAETAGIKVTPSAVSNGFRGVKWPGRLQRIGREPDVILDVGHNPAAMTTLWEYFKEFYPQRNIIVVFGILSDKDSVKMLQTVERFAGTIILTKPMSDRAADPEMLAHEASKITTNFQVIPHVRDAYKAALEFAKPTDVVLVTGSHYTVGEILASFEGRD